MPKFIPTAALSFAAACSFVSLSASAQTLTTLYQFSGGADGLAPDSLVYHNSAFYGSTAAGGSPGCYKNLGCGTIFKFDPATGTKTILHVFSGAAVNPASTVFGGSNIFGVASGSIGTPSAVVFKLNPVSGEFSILHSFGVNGYPLYVGGPVVFNNGALYGTTENDGATQSGKIFEIDAKTGNETDLYEFTSNADGWEPESNLIYSGGVLYGRTSGGGAHDSGTVFKFDLATGIKAILYSFTEDLSGTEVRNQIALHNGFVYGTTSAGGLHNRGTVYRVDVSTGTETTLSNIYNPTGSWPTGVGFNEGYLYGAYEAGGPERGGTIFKMNARSGVQTNLYSFPKGGYVADIPPIVVGGALYGLTGDSSGLGRIYKLTP
jgi:uncharacterized repeat protein (TIGR03803 family)